MMEIEFKEQAIEDIKLHKRSGNKAAVKKIIELIEDIKLHPRTGIGQVEPLKHELSDYWSRHINKKHRLIYRIDDENNTVYIISAYSHYSDK